MKYNRIEFLGSYVDNLSMSETISEIEKAIENGNQIHHVVVNAGKIVSLQKDQALKESVNSADIINADGQAIVWAAKLLGTPLRERVAGIDLFTNLLKVADQKKYKVYLLGAKQEVLEKVKTNISNTYHNDIVAGSANGYFDEAQEKLIIEDIVSCEPQMLFVAMTSPKKELFLHRNKELLKNVNFIMGVGGSFDVLSGNIKRAPVWLQKIGMEWFFRLIQDPRRMWKRYLYGNLNFILLVLNKTRSSKNK
ncbi:MAG: WecB/TagA/CpsF family glycosyltransferase [Flavobacterium sp.]|nr:WecB/TagA/CpsF family glycosyltransferase [Flavobacterium sp.]